ncbi:translocation/assembly module TamB domain-containing protein [bacterium]|nr:translocation/assembly module TamB domain-containing protein [bacterium]
MNRAKKKRGIRLALLGMLLGLSLGFGKIFVEQTVEQLLVDLLQEEAEKAGGLDFEVAHVDFSLFTLTGTAHNARIVEGGVDQLVVPRITAKFNLFQKIAEKKIALTSLNLYDAHASGVGPEDGAFRFIQELARPLPEAEKQKFKIRVKLMRLDLFDGALTHQLPGGEIRAEGVSLKLVRDENDDLHLTPGAKSFGYRLSPSSSQEESPLFLFGDLKSELFITDDDITVRELALQTEESFLRLSAAIEKYGREMTTVSSQARGDLTELRLPWLTSGVITAEGELASSLDGKSGRFTFSTDSEHPVGVAIGDLSLPPLSLESTLTIDSSHTAGETLSLDPLAITFPGGALRAIEPISISGARPSGVLAFSFSKLELKQATLLDGDFSIDLSPPGKNVSTEASRYTLRGTVGGVLVEEMLLPGATTEVSLTGERLDFSLSQQTPETGTLDVRGRVTSLFHHPKLEELVLDLQELPLWDTTAVTGAEARELFTLTADGTFSGSLEVTSREEDQLRGEMSLIVSSETFSGESAFRGALTLSGDTVQWNIGNNLQSLSLVGEVPLSPDRQSSVHLELRDFKPQQYFPQLRCLQADLQADYQFFLSAPWDGSGEISLQELQLGCRPYQTLLAHPQQLSIEAGTLRIRELEFESPNASLLLRGQITEDEVEISAEGGVLLRSFLSLAPQLDDLSGELGIEISVTGDLQSPRINGIATVQNGGLAIESGDIVLSRIAGDIFLRDDEIFIDSVNGNFNGGRIVLRGTLLPEKIAESKLSLEFEQVLYQPDVHTFAIFSGTLLGEQAESGIPLLRGEIVLENGETLQEFDVRDLIVSVPSTLLGKAAPKNGGPRRLPNIELDLAIRSSGNVFAITSFFGVELAGEVFVRGDLASPSVKGEILSKRGWVGMNETRFEIHSGKAEFRPPSVVPYLTLLGETYVRGPRGENALVLLKASGPILSPEVSLSSDQGLSEREILGLLGTRSDFRMGSTSFGDNNSLELPSSLRKRKQKTLFGKFLHEVTKIDTLSLQPKFNARRGQLEPALIAERRLLPRLNLLAESFLSSPEEGSQFFLRYKLGGRTQLIGTLDTTTIESESSVGADLGYTILSRETNFVEYRFSGFQHFSPLEISERLRLSQESQLTEEEATKIGREIRELYRAEGFLGADIQTRCTPVEKLCREIHFILQEGPQSRISHVSNQGDPLPEEIQVRLEREVRRRPFATGAFQEELKRQIIRKLRSDGFLQSRVQLRYDYLPSESGSERQLVINLERGSAITLIFKGNKHFSEEELLETINLFERRQPFGNNTVKILVRNIERFYREAGYLYASVQLEEQESPDQNRKIFQITVREEEKISVSKAEFHGLHQITADDLEQQFREEGAGKVYEEIRNPTLALQEEISRNARILEKMLDLLGFHRAEVEGEIVPEGDAASVAIVYTVTEGERLLVEALQLRGFPVKLSAPETPNAPYSLPKMERYIEELRFALEEGGYLHPSISPELDAHKMILQIDPGKPETLHSIRIVGNNRVDEEEILAGLPLQVGKVWSQKAVQRSRALLLAKGLFSRVTIERHVDEHGKTSAIITVLERPLQTLELGGGVNSVFGLHLFGEAVERELFLDGRNLSLRFDTFYNDTEGELSRGLAGLRYSNPSFSSLDLHHTEDLRFEKLELATQEFNLDRISFASALADTQEAFSYSLSHTIFQEDLSNVTPGAVLDPELDTGDVRLSFLSLSASLDGRDNPLSPKKGFNVGGEVRFSHEALGSEADYTSLLGRAAYLFPFQLRETRFGLATGLRSGISVAHGATDSIPISQRFYLGGRTTIRGFRENSLGPRGPGGAVIGGDLFVALNTEFRYFPTDALELHLFFDSGSPFVQDIGVSSEELRYSTGVGFRYLSPIGPIGFDLGAPLDERSGEPSLRLHFSIGSLF